MNNEKLAGMKIGEPVIGHVVDCSKLNVRKEPDEDAEILGTIPAGAEVMIDERCHQLFSSLHYCLRK